MESTQYAVHGTEVSGHYFKDLNTKLDVGDGIPPSRPLRPHPWRSSPTSSRPCPDHAGAGHARLASAQPHPSNNLLLGRVLGVL